MTDKQIIIEDCPYFVNGVCMEYLDGACENHKCDLKIIRELEQKLKAKEQECEGLRYEIGSLENDRDILQEQLDQLKVENEELKSLLKVRIEDLCDSCGASSMMPMPCKVYEKTLTEIKEIAEQGVMFEQILQKISECEGNDD